MGDGGKEGEKEIGMERGRRKESLKVALMNAQSIVNKINELRAMVVIMKPDVIAVTETWANDAIGDALLTIDEYEMVARHDRNDTEGGRGGGILVYAEKSICAWQIDNDTSFNQLVSVKIKNGCEDFILSVIYRSPNSSRVNDEALCNWMNRLSGTNLLIGDFNYPDIDWENGISGSRGRTFYETTADLYMEQHVLEATHVSGNTLDLILSNREGLVRAVKSDGRIGKSDHDVITFEVMAFQKKVTEQIAGLNYRRANYTEMRATLEGETGKE